jgi:HAD-superfamily subfamily IB hydrolase, TIGR01490
MISNKKFAVFDVDGTLIRWQLYHAIVNRLAVKGFLGKESSKELKTARMKWKVRENDDSFKDYEKMLVDLWTKNIHRVNYQDYLNTVTEITNEYLEQTYTYTRNLIEDLKEDGYFLLAVSGSPIESIELIAKRYGFDDFVTAKFDRDESGKFTGHFSSPIHDKAKHLKILVEKHNLTWKDSVAVGDTSSDIAMLELVEKPIAFNPEKNLAHVAKDNGWQIVVERKNVIYKLQPDKGGWKVN